MTTFPQDNNGESIPALRPTLNQKVSFTASSAQSTAFVVDTNVIRVVADQDCFLEFGPNPTATSASTFLPGGVIEYFKVRDREKVAAIQSTTAGTLYITEMT